MRDAIVAALALGCAGKTTDGDPHSGSGTDPTDTPTDADTDTDADADTDADTDTDVEPQALLVHEGVATTAGAWTGTETVRLVGDYGYGDTLCEIAYGVDSTGPRTDCPGCEFAYDVVTSGTTVLIDEGGACGSVLGVDATTAASWDGTTHAYGYDAEYFGHAEVMMTDLAGTWNATAYVTYDPGTSELTYDWEDGLYGY